MKKRRRENVVQSAIKSALEFYCNDKGIRIFPPYSNQQGEQLRKYCADIVGLLDDSKIILLEIKEYDCTEKILQEFKIEQHSSMLEFEKMGVPIGYAYNSTPTMSLEYCKSPRAPSWPTLTLKAVKRSEPSKLPNRSPAVQSHKSLLCWLQEQNGSDTTKLTGKIHGILNSPDQLTNGALVLLYGISKKSLASLTPDEFEEIFNFLDKNSTLFPKHEKRLLEIFGESAKIFSRFSKNQTNNDINTEPTF